MNKLVLIFIRSYKSFVSPFLGNRCRFHPSCSQYAFECFQLFPFFKALWYSIKRILKCHPFHSGGYDPTELLKLRNKGGRV